MCREARPIFRRRRRPWPSSRSWTSCRRCLSRTPPRRGAPCDREHALAMWPVCRPLHASVSASATIISRVVCPCAGSCWATSLAPKVGLVTGDPSSADGQACGGWAELLSACGKVEFDVAGSRTDKDVPSESEGNHGCLAVAKTVTWETAGEEDIEGVRSCCRAERGDCRWFATVASKKKAMRQSSLLMDWIRIAGRGTIMTIGNLMDGGPTRDRSWYGLQLRSVQASRSLTQVSRRMMRDDDDDGGERSNWLADCACAARPRALRKASPSTLVRSAR